jgi:hypothetical protein
VGDGCHCVDSTLSISSSSEADMCGVCMDAAPAVCLVPCSHRLCVECCSSMLGSDNRSVLVCPFCRSHVGALAA